MFRRNLFSGELEEVESSGQGRQLIYVEPVAYRPKRYANPWDNGKDHVNRGMSIKPEEATPEKIALLNENARKHGTGASYSPEGVCYTPTRRSRSKEMGARATVDFGFQDNDAGYGDCAGR